MASKQRYHLSILLVDGIFLLFVVIAMFHLAQKAILPPTLVTHLPLKVEGTLISDEEQLEFFLGTFRVGDTVHVSLTRQALEEHDSAVRLVSYYPFSYIIFDGIISLVIFGLGLFVYLFRPGEIKSKIFHLASTATAIAVLAVKTMCMIEPHWIGCTAGFIFFSAYGLLAVFFLHFTFVFPEHNSPLLRARLPVAYAVGSVLALLHFTLYLAAAWNHSVTAFERSMPIAHVQNGFISVLCLLGVGKFIVSYLTAESRGERKKLRWILFGLCFGPTPFIALWFLPQALNYPPIVSEIIPKCFLLLIPITFAISILKYKVLDIDLLLNRGVVYTLVVIPLLVLYALLVGGVTIFIDTHIAFGNAIPFALAAVVIALVFEPLRRSVQKFVDRYFFRVEYDFRVAQRMLAKDISECLDSREIGMHVVRQVAKYIPVEIIGVFALEKKSQRLRLLAHEGMDVLERHGVRFEGEKLRSNLGLPVARENSIENGVPYEVADALVFERWGMALVIAMHAREGAILGFLVLGKKKSGLRFTEEDVDLLQSIAEQVGFVLERLALQRNILLEHEEAERLNELNHLKSFFVSSVSHDMKTPLTSIKMFAELLQSKQRSSEETKEYLQIIEGESDRLTRLINNVLDFAIIERGIKQYHLADVDFNVIVQSALSVMNYQFLSAGFCIRQDLYPDKLFVRVDSDAMVESVLNLLANAMKYSPDRKEIDISTFVENGFGGVCVRDKGIGISEKDRERIFEPFFRSSHEGAIAEGIGLGLAIVKHTIDAHGGKIRIESKEGEGSAFTLLLPKIKSFTS